MTVTVLQSTRAAQQPQLKLRSKTLIQTEEDSAGRSIRHSHTGIEAKRLYY